MGKGEGRVFKGEGFRSHFTMTYGRRREGRVGGPRLSRVNTMEGCTPGTLSWCPL